MRVIYRKIRHAPYLYIKRNVEKVWGARYTLGARYLSKNTVYCQGDMFRPLLVHLQALWENRPKSHLYFKALRDPKCILYPSMH